MSERKVLIAIIIVALLSIFQTAVNGKEAAESRSSP